MREKLRLQLQRERLSPERPPCADSDQIPHRSQMTRKAMSRPPKCDLRTIPKCGYLSEAARATAASKPMETVVAGVSNREKAKSAKQERRHPVETILRIAVLADFYPSVENTSMSLSRDRRNSKKLMRLALHVSQILRSTR